MAKTTAPKPAAKAAKKAEPKAAPKKTTAPKAEPKKVEPKKVEPKKAEPKAELPKSRGENCSSVARDLILAGKTNAEVWAVIKEKFNLDDKKKGYPAWYRMDLKRRGIQIPA